MGAIKATELSKFGMIGFGRVYDEFVSKKLDDDEVTQLHDQDTYLSFSEPLINIRFFIDFLVTDNSITKIAGDEIIESLKKCILEKELSLF